jgi:glycosyltransferase involved in cell wall biosynthesis
MERVQILHVDIATRIPALSSGTEACLVIFWWNDCPVGQVETRGPAGRCLDLEALIASAVAPDVLERAQGIVGAETLSSPALLPPASVIICTRDRPESLAQCLAALPRQTFRPAQVIVVDNASRDGRTKEVALAAGVDYIREDRPGLGVARNTGTKQATGEIVAYTDDDVVLHPRWLERMVGAFGTSPVAAVTGLVLPAELETEPQCYFQTYWGFGRGYRPIDFGPEFFTSNPAYGCPAWEIGAGASMAFRRDIFTKVGFFDERLGVGRAGCSEDSEYWHRILGSGGVCRYEPTAVAFHYHRRDFAGLSKQIYLYLRGHVAALLVQYERSGNRANLRRAFVWMPRYLGSRVVKRLAGRGSELDRFVLREMAGYVSGLAYYMRQPRPGAARRTP